MAVLAPVLERKLNTEENVATVDTKNTNLTAEERHNSRIKVNYAKLINPDATIGDVLPKGNVAQQQQFVEPIRAQKPFLVENARADADIFRADSKINRLSAVRDEEEENEDLRPTATTIQYKSDVASKIVIDDKISNKQTKLSKLSKRDKIIMAVAFVVIAALFILVIINSAVLSNLNNEVDYLQNDLANAQENYAEIVEEKNTYWENIEETVKDFAEQNGMVKY